MTITVQSPKLGYEVPTKAVDPRTKPTMYRMPGVPPKAVATHNVYIEFDNGDRIIDGMGGAAVNIIGFGQESVIKAMKEEMDRCGFIYAGQYSNAAAEDLAEFLISKSEGYFSGVNFVGGGSEAIESALKLAKQYFWEKGDTVKRRFIGRQMSYHGNTIATLSIGYHPIKRRPFASFVNEDVFSWVSPAHYFHYGREGETEEEYATRLADELEAEILRLGPETVAGFVAEPMVASSQGATCAPKTYWPKIRAVCDKYDVLLIMDEVMSGMWRTGRMYTFPRICEGVQPDILGCAKGLGAGYVPIGAIMAAPKIMDAIHNGSGAWNHGFTYTSFGVSAAGALAVQKYMYDNNVEERIYALEKQIGTTLKARLLGPDSGLDGFVIDVRGVGLMWAIEVKAPGQKDMKKRIAHRMMQRALENGLMVLGMAGLRADNDGDCIMLCPPAVLTEAQMDTICDLAVKTVKDIRAELQAEGVFDA